MENKEQYTIILYVLTPKDVTSNKIEVYLTPMEVAVLRKNLTEKITELVNINMPVGVSFIVRNETDQEVSYGFTSVCGICHNLPNYTISDI